MKTTFHFSIAQTFVLSLILSFNALLAQNQNISPPGVTGGNQNKSNTPTLLAFELSNSNSMTENATEEEAVLNIIVNQTVWDGFAWSNGFPNYSTKAVFNADFETADVIEAYSIQINPLASVTVNSSGILKIYQPLENVTKSKLKLLPGSGLLIKTIDARNLNSSMAMFQRSHPTIVNQYTGLYMSSPVTGQTIGGTNPSTAYSQSIYNNSGYQDIADTTVMLPAVGYTETGDGNGNFTGVAPSQGGPFHIQTYVGTENTGTYSVMLDGAGGYNLVGNPYANYLDADRFLQDSSNATAGSIYLWTHNTLASTTGNGSGTFSFTSNDFAAYNLLGGVNAGKDISLGGSNTTMNYDIPDGKIAFGTGFFLLGSGTATFRPTMTTTTGSQIFRASGHNDGAPRSAASTPPPARHRIWLNLNNQAGAYRQTMIGYAVGASKTGSDPKFDTPTIDQTSAQPLIDLYSFAPSSTTKLAIQGYALSGIQNSDFFQLGYKVTTAGTYTFTATHDGMFGPTTKPYYIQDTTTGQYHTLPYTFTTNAGTFDTRFRVVFENLIGFVAPANVCGSQLNSIWNLVYALSIPGVTTYKFRIINPNGSIFGEFDGISPTAYYIRNLNIPGIQYNTTYSLQVATYQVNGVWQYGPICQVTSPPPPTAKLTDTVGTNVGSCGSTISNFGTTLYSNSPTEIGFSTTGFRFQVSTTSSFAPGTVGTVENTANAFSLAQLRPAYNPLPSTVYYVRVQIRYGNSPATQAWQVDINGNPIYGPVCTVTTTANATGRLSDSLVSIFQVAGFPNPFSNNFKFEINTSSEEQISLQIFDMLGRQVESRIINISDLNTQDIGQSYSSGIYNVMVKQGENIKTIRMIKR